jgi:hypothetical protein
MSQQQLVPQRDLVSDRDGRELLKWDGGWKSGVWWPWEAPGKP